MSTKHSQREKRRRRVRKRVQGTRERPRLSIYRSLSHIYAQLIDDVAGCTLISASTLDPELKGRVNGTANAQAAHEVGKLIGQRAVGAGHKKVVFDRNGYPYHGRVKSLADGAREAGLEF